MKKEVLIIGIVYFLVTTGLIIYLFMNREIVIKYPPIKTSEVTYEIKYKIFELPRHEINMLSSYYDANNSFHQIYRDVVNIKKNSAEISWITKVDVNSDVQKAVIEYDSIKIKYYEKVVTNTVIDTILTEKECADKPFYSNNWFWIWAWEKVVLIFGIFIGVIL